MVATVIFISSLYHFRLVCPRTPGEILTPPHQGFNQCCVKVQRLGSWRRRRNKKNNIKLLQLLRVPGVAEKLAM